MTTISELLLMPSSEVVNEYKLDRITKIFLKCYDIQAYNYAEDTCFDDMPEGHAFYKEHLSAAILLEGDDKSNCQHSLFRLSWDGVPFALMQHVITYEEKGDTPEPVLRVTDTDTADMVVKFLRDAQRKYDRKLMEVVSKSQDASELMDFGLCHVDLDKHTLTFPRVNQIAYVIGMMYKKTQLDHIEGMGWAYTKKGEYVMCSTLNEAVLGFMCQAREMADSCTINKNIVVSSKYDDYQNVCILRYCDGNLFAFTGQDAYSEDGKPETGPGREVFLAIVRQTADSSALRFLDKQAALEQAEFEQTQAQMPAP